MKKSILLVTVLGVLLMVAPVWGATSINVSSRAGNPESPMILTYAGNITYPWYISETFTGIGVGDLRFSSEIVGQFFCFV